MALPRWLNVALWRQRTPEGAAEGVQKDAPGQIMPLDARAGCLDGLVLALSYRQPSLGATWHKGFPRQTSCTSIAPALP